MKGYSFWYDSYKVEIIHFYENGTCAILKVGSYEKQNIQMVWAREIMVVMEKEY